jgi:hypothetical protein
LFFHDELIFSFEQIKFYAAMGRAFMGWVQFSPCSFVTTN